MAALLTKNTDCIIYFGGPCSGKTLHFYRSTEISAAYDRVEPSKILSENHDLNLRLLINNFIVDPLLKGKRICIDDDNGRRSIRKSYISTVNRKVDQCSFRCIIVKPVYGELQQLWQLQWLIAEAWIMGRPEVRDVNIEEWNHLSELPLEDEGYTSIATIESKLQTLSNFKFEVPALLLQWESLINKDNTLIAGVTEAIEKWYQVNPCGRICVIQAGHNQSGESKNELEWKIKCILKEITAKVSDAVLYFLQINSVKEAGRFCCPPQHGILAFLQRLHHLDLHAKGTLYLYHTIDHMKMAETAGVQHIKASRVFVNPKLASNYYGAAHPPIPPLLTDINLLPANASYPLPQNPEIPLERDTNLSCKEREGRKLYIAYKDSDTLNRYISVFKTNATLSTAEGSKISSLVHHEKTRQPQPPVMLSESRRGLPSWMIKRQKPDAKNENVSSPLKGRSKKLRKADSNSPGTLYVMTPEELVETAKEVLVEVGIPIPSPDDQQEHNVETSVDQTPLRTPTKRICKTTPSQRKSRRKRSHIFNVGDSDDESMVVDGVSPEKSKVYNTYVSETETSSSCTRKSHLCDDSILDSLVPNTSDSSKMTKSQSSSNTKLSSETGPKSHVSDNLVKNTSDSNLSNTSHKTSLVVPDSLVRNTASSSMSSSREQLGKVIVPDSFVPNSSSSSKPSVKSGSFAVPDSLVKCTSSSKEKSNSFQSKGTIPDSLVSGTSSNTHGSSKGRLSDNSLHSKTTIPDSFVGETSTTSSANSSKDSKEPRTIPDSLVMATSSGDQSSTKSNKEVIECTCIPDSLEAEITSTSEKGSTIQRKSSNSYVESDKKTSSNRRKRKSDMDDFLEDLLS